MKKKLLTVLILTFISLLLWGIGKLYIAYNLSHYAGYYVQHMPRKEGTNPELVIILTHLDSVERPEVNGITYNLRGNGGIIKDDSFYLFDVSDEFQLTISDEDGDYFFNHDNGELLYYYTDDIDNTNSDTQYKKEVELLLEKILSPILEAQPKPKINLQNLFNEKYYKQFNE